MKEKIEKLLKHARSAREIGSLEEAEAFAEKAQALMMRYAIEVDLSSLDEDDEATEIGKTTVGDYEGRQSRYKQRLAKVIAESHLCRILVVPGTSRIIFIGQADHREIAAEVFIRLLDTLERNRKRDRARARRAGENVEGYTPAYRSGFITAISRRMSETRKAIEGESTEQALVKLDTYRQAVDDFIDAMNVRKGRGLQGRRGWNERAFERGKTVGSKAPVSPSSRKRLEGGSQ